MGTFLMPNVNEQVQVKDTTGEVTVTFLNNQPVINEHLEILTSINLTNK